MNKKFLFDVVTAIVLALVVMVLSLGIGFLKMENYPKNPFAVQQFHWISIMTYQCLLGVFMAWKLCQHEVPIGEPITYLLAPNVLYYYSKGDLAYYFALLALAYVVAWRTLHHVRHTSKRVTEEIEKEEAAA